MAGETAFLRGEEYYLRGMVRSLAWDGQCVRADVQGTKRRPYQVTVVFAQGSPSLRCDCPYHWGGICKHGVAVLLYILDYGSPAGVQPAADSTDDEEDFSTADGARAGAGSALKDFLLAACDAPRLQLVLTVKGLQKVSTRGISFGLALFHQGKAHKLTDLDGYLSPDRYVLNNQLPSLATLSSGQEHFIKMVRGFVRESGAHDAFRWRMQPFQLSALLDTVSREKDIEIVEPKGGRNFVLTQDPPVGLRVEIRATAKNKIGVRAALVDPLRPDRQARLADIFAGSRAWLFDAEAWAFRPLHPRIDGRFLVYFLDAERVLASDERQHFLAGVLPQLREFAEVVLDDPKAYDWRIESVPPRARYEIDAERGEIGLSLSFDYGGCRLDYPSRGPEAYVERSGAEGRVLVRRDVALEGEIAERLVREYKCILDEKKGRFFISSTDTMFDFLSGQVHDLAKTGDVFLSDKAKALYRAGEEIRPRLKVVGCGIDWFEYDIAYRLAGVDIVIPAKVIREHLAQGRKFVRLKTGEFVRLDAAAFDRVAELLADREHSGKLMLAHIPFIMDELSASGIEVEVDAETKRLYEELKGLKGIEVAAVPASLEGVLRDYQRHGISWMAFLRQFRFGGILADEMGLGKTLQALTMIQRDIEAGSTQPSLVVCPTTLVWNWEAEVRKFLPGIKALVISGKDRLSLMKEIPSAQVVVTSYALLRRDIGKYHEHKFHYLILDEAQNIKNRHTISARVAKQLNADHRLALTGTPLENSVADIWSIFDFLMPSFLGNYERFRATYEIPIVQEQDVAKLKQLSRRIAPFVLRRLKQDVLKELPEKIEQTSFCELEPAQAKIYASMAEKARREATEAYRSQGLQRSRMLILTLLLRLRQICCHPELAGIRLKHRIGVSAKTDLLKETLLELLSSGHRVLVFSQFVGMLSIIRDHLDREKVVYEYMDGRTKDRQQRVEHFNNDPSVAVFLLSLKVGGLGLNLTAADTVILYEPWWNPAVEQQAIDRTHRIGQQKPVLAYHLIARGTIEEKIQELQRRKKFLMSSLVLSEESVSKKLDWEDIRFLLGFEDVPADEGQAAITTI